MGFFSYVSSAFSSTQFLNNAAYNGAALGANAAFHFMANEGGRLKFQSPRGYENVLVYAAKRTMMQLAFAKINDLYPAYVKKLDKERFNSAYAMNQGSQMETIIRDGQLADTNLQSKQNVTVKYMGKPLPEALVIWVQNEKGEKNDVPINTYWDKIKCLSNEGDKTAKSVVDTQIQVPADKDKVFVDLGPKVQVQSANNVVLTKVQGRDFSRKELISGGDFNFSVTGKIVSNYPDVYPYAEVSKFLTLMLHKGVLHVSNLLFGQLNVSQIIIKDFQMGQNEGFKNEQPYSFTCVAVEPDEAVQVVQDTINVNNLNIKKMPKKGWQDKLLEQVKAAAANQAAQMVEQLTSKVI